MKLKKKLLIIAIVFVLTVVMSFVLTACSDDARSGELSVNSLRERLIETLKAEDYFVNRTVYTMVDGGKSGSKQNKDWFKIASSTKNEDRIYFKSDSTRYHIENDTALNTTDTVELWWSNTYETIADFDSKNETLKKPVTVWREEKWAEKLDGGKKVYDETISYNKAYSNPETRQNLFEAGGLLAEYGLNAVLKPFIDALADENNIEVVNFYAQGSLDFYELKIKDSYSSDAADNGGDILNNFKFSELGLLTFTVINTEEYNRISSITNIDEKESALYYETYFSYAAPPIAVQECAEKYVSSINDPQPEKIDNTMLYVIIGLACGLGIPLIGLLIWFIIHKFRIFKDYNPDEMSVEEYIKRYKCKKKGIPYTPETEETTETLADGEAESQHDIDNDSQETHEVGDEIKERKDD